LLPNTQSSIFTAIAPFSSFGPPEKTVLVLLVALIVIVATLTAVLWSGSLFAQSYLYTSPADGLYWRAPAAAGALTSFYLVWSLLNVLGGSSTAVGIVSVPYGVLWEFSPRVEVIAEPVPRFTSKRRSSEPAVYVIDKYSPRELMYRKVDSDEAWNARGTEYVEFTYKRQAYKFVPDKAGSTAYILFVDENTGLEMWEYEIGRVGYDSYGRLMVYFMLNALHLGIWVLCLWLLLGFEFWHAVGLGFVLWMLATVAILPGLCEAAAGAIIQPIMP
jgi:hypothetical protein